MRDGRTRVQESCTQAAERSFLDDHRITLVVKTGPAAGSEFSIIDRKTIIGRGAQADLTFIDTSMSSEHAAIEAQQDCCRIRDLASTNGLRVNGSPILQAELKHGDNIELGEHCFQLLIEKSPREPSTYILPDS
jgi:pSer/pThr/pTyr-binding forkhead associated (FHA) protein